jgi:hypothetical protein
MTGLPFFRNISADSPVPDPMSATVIAGVRPASMRRMSRTAGG